MTTIAMKDGIMACDSAWQDVNGGLATSMTKIVRLPSGALLGGAGAADDRAVVKILEKCKTFAQLPTAKELADTEVDYHGLIAFPNGTVAQIEVEMDDKHGRWSASAHPVNVGGTSVGSGSGYAIGAMDAGATAKRAVECAIKRDPQSRGPVHVVPLKKLPIKR